MPANLPDRALIVLKQIGRSRPVVKQTADPGHADQPDTDLDAARPVHARQEWILPPPGAQLAGDEPCVSLVAAEEPGRGKQRQMLQPRQFPDLLDVSRLVLRPVIDPEGVPRIRRTTAGNRVQEPVRRPYVGPENAEYFPLPSQDPVCCGQNGSCRGDRHLRRGARRNCRGELATPRGFGMAVLLIAMHLADHPGRLQGLVMSTPEHLGWRHLGEPARIPPEPRLLRRAHSSCSGPPISATAPLITSPSSASPVPSWCHACRAGGPMCI